MYYLAKYEERNAPLTYKNLKRLSDFRNSSWRVEGSKHVVYKSHRDVRLNKVHAFYTVKDGCLVRDKYRTAMHQIREMFKSKDRAGQPEESYVQRSRMTSGSANKIITQEW